MRVSLTKIRTSLSGGTEATGLLSESSDEHHGTSASWPSIPVEEQEEDDTDACRRSPRRSLSSDISPKRSPLNNGGGHNRSSFGYNNNSSNSPTRSPIGSSSSSSSGGSSAGGGVGNVSPNASNGNISPKRSSLDSISSGVHNRSSFASTGSDISPTKRSSLGQSYGTSCHNRSSFGSPNRSSSMNSSSHARLGGMLPSFSRHSSSHGDRRSQRKARTGHLSLQDGGSGEFSIDIAKDCVGSDNNIVGRGSGSAKNQEIDKRSVRKTRRTGHLSLEDDDIDSSGEFASCGRAKDAFKNNVGPPSGEFAMPESGKPSLLKETPTESTIEDPSLSSSGSFADEDDAAHILEQEHQHHHHQPHHDHHKKIVALPTREQRRRRQLPPKAEKSIAHEQQRPMQPENSNNDNRSPPTTTSNSKRSSSRHRRRRLPPKAGERTAIARTKSDDGCSGGSRSSAFQTLWVESQDGGSSANKHLEIDFSSHDNDDGGEDNVVATAPTHPPKIPRSPAKGAAEKASTTSPRRRTTASQHRRTTPRRTRSARA